MNPLETTKVVSLKIFTELYGDILCDFMCKYNYDDKKRF